MVFATPAALLLVAGVLAPPQVGAKGVAVTEVEAGFEPGRSVLAPRPGDQPPVRVLVSGVGGLAWLSGDLLAACGLSPTMTALVGREPGSPAPRLIVVRDNGPDGQYDLVLAVDLPPVLPPIDERASGRDAPPAATAARWSLAANGERLFLASGDQVFQSRHASTGVSVPKPFAKLDGRVESLAVDGKGYLAALVAGAASVAGAALVAGADEGCRLVFLDPTAADAGPLATFALAMPAAGAHVAYRPHAGSVHWPLFAAAGDQLFRIESRVGSRGGVQAEAIALIALESSVRGLAGAPTGAGGGSLFALVGDTLLELDDRSNE